MSTQLSPNISPPSRLNLPQTPMATIRPNPTLSEDLISEILVRVPVKPLLCFQLVCKTWLSLIKHPTFVMSQLRHAITTQTDQTFINILRIPGGETKFALLNVDSRQIVANPRFPGALNTLDYYMIVGCVNGIVCIIIWNDGIYLWNPAIRQYKVIPCHDLRIDAVGFGYDEVDHDYKVVKFGPDPSSRFEVFSANTNVWRKVPNPTDTPISCYFDLCFKGFLCGIRENGMLAFDLNKEVLNCGIQLPFIRDDVEPRLFEFNKSIVVIKYMDDVLNDSKLKMWMLDDDACLGGVGVEASWTPLSVTIIGRVREIDNGFFSNGAILLMVLDYCTRSMWVSCNVDKKDAKIVPISFDLNGYFFSWRFCKYTESLVTLPGFKQVNWNAASADDK